MQMPRREFLKSATVASAVTTLGSRAPAAAGILKKAVVVSMLPDRLPYLDRFKICRDAGFDGVEGQTVADPKVAEAIRAAASVLNCMKELGIDPDRVNVMGGGTAIGHALGGTGIRLVGTLARILKIKGGHYGLANACVGGGQGVATIIEREP